MRSYYWKSGRVYLSRPTESHWVMRPPLSPVGSFVSFFFSSRRRHTRSLCDWSSDVCSSDLTLFLLLIWGYNEYTYCAAIAQARKEQGLRREPCSCVLGDGLLIHNL